MVDPASASREASTGARAREREKEGERKRTLLASGSLGRREFTADTDVRAVRGKYRLRPLFRSIRARRMAARPPCSDKRSPRREKERNERAAWDRTTRREEKERRRR